MPDQGSNQFVAARIDCALQERTIGPQALFTDSRWFVFFLESGGATVLTQGENYEMAGPAVIWGPMDDDTRLKIGAGGVGSYLLLSDLILSDAIGRVTEAGELALFAQQPIMLSFGQNDRRGEELDRMFEQITGEARGGQFGAEIAIAAYVRLLLVLLWRSLDREALTRDTIGTHKSELMRFRNLVEAHFRARWKAQQYAHALGLTYDRLHDLCVRALGKPPALVVRERSFHEAQILLQRTSLNADRISAILGFSSASQFNHFYKSMSGETPGRYRRSILMMGADQDEKAAPRFSDWP